MTDHPDPNKASTSAQNDEPSLARANREQHDPQIEAVLQQYSPSGLRRRRRSRMLRWAAATSLLGLVTTAKRLLDLLISASLLALFTPVLLIITLGLGGPAKALFRSPRLGRFGIPFKRLSFRTPENGALRKLGLHHLPVLINLLRGDMSLIGPRAADPSEYSPRERKARRRYNVRPGLVGPWWIRRRANIDFGSELDADAEYVAQQSLSGDLGLAFRAIPALLYGQGLASASDEIRILGIDIDNLTMDEAIETMLAVVDQDRPQQLCFVNADCFNIAARNDVYRQCLKDAQWVFADGIGVKLAGKILNRDIKQNVNGTDLFPRLCDAMQGTDKSLYLLGARPGIAQAVAEWVAEHYPDCRIAGHHHGYLKDDSEEQAVLADIRESGADMLMVAFGAPRQDLWVAEHLQDSGVKLAMGVGGLFDFYSGRIARAPQWMREMALEWLFRFLQEPRRMWRRYFVGNFVFLIHIYRERFFGAPK
ncbi:MAG: WecB/TagA/CpsF family glycosyltransferase [Gammaproteobacteria bacterium]|nr:WecB/TagA/CpsF family glycosyltransferase [Gammaproteobacteria bacterium]MCP5136671.1 WecB/TagA/CpsF family glycosyltransferase [Gammaproteobacteria bacterium]